MKTALSPSPWHCSTSCMAIIVSASKPHGNRTTPDKIITINLFLCCGVSWVYQCSSSKMSIWTNVSVLHHVCFHSTRFVSTWTQTRRSYSMVFFCKVTEPHTAWHTCCSVFIHLCKSVWRTTQCCHEKTELFQDASVVVWIGPKCDRDPVPVPTLHLPQSVHLYDTEEKCT